MAEKKNTGVKMQTQIYLKLAINLSFLFWNEKKVQSNVDDEEKENVEAGWGSKRKWAEMREKEREWERSLNSPPLCLDSDQKKKTNEIVR